MAWPVSTDMDLFRNYNFSSGLQIGGSKSAFDRLNDRNTMMESILQFDKVNLPV